MLFQSPILIIVYLTSMLFMSWQLTLFVFILLPIMGLLIGLPKVAVGVPADNDAGNDFWERQGFAVRDDLVYRELPL